MPLHTKRICCIESNEKKNGITTRVIHKRVQNKDERKNVNTQHLSLEHDAILPKKKDNRIKDGFSFSDILEGLL